jgi:hypothetical protein
MLFLIILGNHDKKKSNFVGFLFKIKISIGMKNKNKNWVIFRLGRKHFFICDGKN